MSRTRCLGRCRCRTAAGHCRCWLLADGATYSSCAAVPGLTFERVDADWLATARDTAERRWTRGPWTDGWPAGPTTTRQDAGSCRIVSLFW